MTNVRGRTGQGLFGYGRDGLPGEIDMTLSMPDGIEHLASEIVEKWNVWAETHGARGGRRLAEKQLAEISTLASILVRYHVRHNITPTHQVADALDCALGLVSPLSGQPIPSPVVLARFGIPVVDNVEAFMDAARLDGEADSQGKELSIRKLSQLTGVSRSTVARWRTEPAYASRRRFVAAYPRGLPSREE